MKYLNRTLALAIMMMLVLAGCNKETANTATGNSDASGASGEKIQLQVNLQADQTWRQQTKTHQVIDQTVMGMEQQTTQDINMWILYKVNEVSEDGIADITVTYERVSYLLSNPMLGDKTWDSKDGTTAPPDFAIGYAALVGKSIGMKMNKHGELEDLTGVDALYDGIIDELGVDPSMSEEIMERVKSSFGEESLKKTMQQAMAIYPKELVGVGDTWGNKTELPGQYSMIVKTKYSVDNIDEGSVVLGVDGTIDTDGNNSMEMGGMTVEYSMDGTQSGTMELDRSTGMISKSSLQQTIKGNMSMMGMEVPMKIKSTITVEPY